MKYSKTSTSELITGNFNLTYKIMNLIDLKSSLCITRVKHFMIKT